MTFKYIHNRYKLEFSILQASIDFWFQTDRLKKLQQLQACFEFKEFCLLFLYLDSDNLWISNVCIRFIIDFTINKYAKCK